MDSSYLPVEDISSLLGNDLDWKKVVAELIVTSQPMLDALSQT